MVKEGLVVSGVVDWAVEVVVVTYTASQASAASCFHDQSCSCCSLWHTGRSNTQLLLYQMLR